MRLPVFGELKPVFEIPQKLVGRGQAGVLLVREQTLVAQAEQGQQRASVTHPRFAAPVQALETLHQELDVANSSPGQLDVEARLPALPRRQLFTDPLARRR